ncbi:hypothetical protein OSB04_un001088 [Centaurea solstitialis]|uniref:Uncharacterized protein n=1 Tax=Centaurea solstitialis TaxID=347529 RepID=A0AA38W5A4_9ASTR|nr:hypothetical protein OSB04_un001088 [Centaurea solstitialis]
MGSKGNPTVSVIMTTTTIMTTIPIVSSNASRLSSRDALHNDYTASNTSKELWQSLEKKYETEDAGSKKFVVA